MLWSEIMDVESGIAMILVGVGNIVAGITLGLATTVCPAPNNYPGCLYNPWTANGVSWAVIILGLFVAAGGSVAFWDHGKIRTPPS